MRNIKKKYVIGGAVLAGAVAFLLFTVLSNSLTYYYTVGELLEEAEERYGESVRVSGNVVEGSIDWDSEALDLRFDIADDSGSLPAIYHGSLPDGFAENKGVLLEGKLNSEGVFEASNILLSCPSKYESQE